MRTGPGTGAEEEEEGGGGGGGDLQRGGGTWPVPRSMCCMGTPRMMLCMPPDTENRYTARMAQAQMAWFFMNGA